MTDKIVYLVTDSGMDGSAPAVAIFASYDEHERDIWHETDKNKAYHSVSKRIVEVEKEEAKAIRKLDAVDKLLLDLNQTVAKK
jgi:hypothetical protein